MTTPAGGVKPLGGGVLLGILPFVDGGDFPGGKLIGERLAAHQALDVLRLENKMLVTPTDQFFIRTGFPARLPTTANWKLRVRGLIVGPAELALQRLLFDLSAMPVRVEMWRVDSKQVYRVVEILCGVAISRCMY